MALDVDVVEVVTDQPVEVYPVQPSVIEVVPQPDLYEVVTVETIVIDIEAPPVTEVVVGIPGPAGPAGPGGGDEVAANDKEVDFVGSDVIYKGDAAPGSALSAPVWRIKKVTFVGEDLSEKYANGSALYDKVWNNRASYTY